VLTGKKIAVVLNRLLSEQRGVRVIEARIALCSVTPGAACWTQTGMQRGGTDRFVGASARLRCATLFRSSDTCSLDSRQFARTIRRRIRVALRVDCHVRLRSGGEDRCGR
jgi:hypothetical protein